VKEINDLEKTKKDMFHMGQKRSLLSTAKDKF